MSRVMTLTGRLLGLVRRPSGPPASLADAEPPEAVAPAAVRRLAHVERTVVAGRPVLRLTPRRGGAGVELLYLHGGAYVHPMESAHWWVVAALLRRTGATITVPDYGLAPWHTVDDALPLLDAVHTDLLARAGTRRVVVAGDSAGGGLALVQAARQREAGVRPADVLLLISPWVEATLQNPAAHALQDVDVLLDCDSLAAAGRLWAGTRDPADPLVSPLRGDLAGLPSLRIYQGGRDLLTPDVRDLAAAASAAGTAVALHQYPDAFHVFPAAFWTPEARHALADMAEATRGWGSSGHRPAAGGSRA
ncbi:MAG: hypothetical protein AVDCRST_MAG48-2767 [uncultured Friedmanniella sp.]|uniref:Alpha/beta hydrolase fold-3 domain-containing protein n=1 Tax=uncultured Friedmanniella sp. TaxID=335381 RepID=A0A6J4L585_9ACTN|nr:MAG: hypothetical protein AVDCRST_MAG48-2767 [uncultured Friedmanniella sp.]